MALFYCRDTALSEVTKGKDQAGRLETGKKAASLLVVTLPPDTLLKSVSIHLLNIRTL